MVRYSSRKGSWRRWTITDSGLSSIRNRTDPFPCSRQGDRFEDLVALLEMLRSQSLFSETMEMCDPESTMHRREHCRGYSLPCTERFVTSESVTLILFIFLHDRFFRVLWFPPSWFLRFDLGPSPRMCQMANSAVVKSKSGEEVVFRTVLISQTVENISFLLDL